MSDPRAIRYRLLALAEPNEGIALLLRTLANEAEKGVLPNTTLGAALARKHAPPVDKPSFV